MKQIINLIPDFFKSKKITSLLIFIILLFSLTPLSINQMNHKIAEFITEKSKIKILHLENQIGLKVEWEDLRFHLLSFSIELKSIYLKEAQNKASNENLLFDFLDETQYIETLFIRPSLFSFLFQNKISLSKVTIVSGKINLKTAKIIKKAIQNKKTLNLPIKKIEIKSTNISLTHQDQQVLLSQINIRLKKRRKERYQFKGFIGETKIHQEDPFSIRINGSFSRNNLQIKTISLKNKKINVKAHSLSTSFKPNKILNFKVNTTGQLPFSSFYNLAQLFGKTIPYDKGNLSYTLNLAFSPSLGYSGEFKIKSKDFYYKDQGIHFLEANGILKGNFLFVKKAKAQLTKEDSIDFIEAKLKLSTPYSFEISSQINKVSLPVFLKTFYFSSFSPIHTAYSGAIHCKGILPSSFTCDIKSKPLDLQIQIESQKIISLHGITTTAKLKSKDNTLTFTAKSTKNKATTLDIKGHYLYKKNELVLMLDGNIKFKEDLHIHTPLSIEGDLTIKKGTIYTSQKSLSFGGLLKTKNLFINNYDLNQIDAFVSYKNNKINFEKLKGYIGKSSYNGTLILDLKKNQIQTYIQSSFVSVQDIIKATKNNIKWPFSISGTGEGSLSLTSPLSNFKEKDFTLKANLFNSLIENEIFKTITLNISAVKGQGVVSALDFQKSTGKIKVTGTFDKNLNLNLTCVGSDIPLERIQNLNHFLPFQQSGIVHFNMNLLGSLYKPKVQLNVSVTKSNLYTYPVKNSQFRIDIDQKNLRLSGNLMKEFYISKLSYPFEKDKPISIKGKLDNFNFIKTVLARYKKENGQSYSSQLSGDVSFTFSKKNFQPLNGNLLLKRFYVSKGEKWFQNQKNFSIKFKDGNSYFDPVNFYHQNNKILKIHKKGTYKLHISGYHSLDYWSFAFLFFNNLEGDLKIDLVTNKNLNNLNPKGTIKIDKGLFSLDLIPTFKNISSSWEIENNKIFIKTFQSIAGKGTNKGTGQIVYVNPKKTLVNLDLNFIDTYLNIPKDFHTKGNGELHITGNKFPYLLKGFYLIESGVIKNEFSSPTKNKFSEARLPFDHKQSVFYADIDLKTKKPVKIENSFINATLQGESRIYGPLNDLLIQGQFTTTNKEVQKGHIIFKQQEFKIDTGAINFNSSKPDNPILNISAQTLFKEKNIDTSFNTTGKEKITEYKIFLKAKGLAQNMDISLESQPALNKKEIISLLTLGVGTQYFEEHIKTNVTQYSYQLLGSFLLQQPLSRELRNKLGLNLNISPALNIQTNEPITKITLRRDWFGKFQTSFSRTLEEFPVSDVNLKYDINPHFFLTASWLNANQYIIIDNYLERDRLGLDLEFNFEF